MAEVEGGRLREEKTPDVFHESDFRAVMVITAAFCEAELMS
jgi:hypothetical protein